MRSPDGKLFEVSQTPDRKPEIGEVPSVREQCPACGARLHSGATFCANCGRQVPGVVRTPQSPPSPVKANAPTEKQPDAPAIPPLASVPVFPPTTQEPAAQAHPIPFSTPTARIPFTRKLLLVGLVLVLLLSGAIYALIRIDGTTVHTVPDPNMDPSGFYAWATSGQPAVTKSFADTTLDWDTDNGCSLVISGSYHVTVQPAPGAVIVNSCLAENTNYINFTFQAAMTIFRDETGGLIFRSNSVPNTEYLFGVNFNSTYFLNSSTLSLDSQSSIVPSRQLPRQLDNTNTLTVIASGHDIYLYMNQQYLTHTRDGTTLSGKIGLFLDAQPSDQGGAEAIFSNLKIWTLP